jgi:hypothetical protein
MQLVSTRQIPLVHLTWRSRRGELTHTIMCKATYVLQPLESLLAGTQQNAAAPPSRQRAPIALALLCAVLAIGIVVLATKMWSQPAHPHRKKPPRRNTELPQSSASPASTGE